MVYPRFESQLQGYRAAGLLRFNSPCLGQGLQPFTQAAIRVYDDAGNVVETHEHKGEFKEW